jgi:hypothetical protein
MGYLPISQYNVHQTFTRRFLPFLVNVSIKYLNGANTKSLRSNTFVFDIVETTVPLTSYY